jgi:hypothetical protein
MSARMVRDMRLWLCRGGVSRGWLGPAVCAGCKSGVEESSQDIKSSQDLTVRLGDIRSNVIQPPSRSSHTAVGVCV